MIYMDEELNNLESLEDKKSLKDTHEHKVPNKYSLKFGKVVRNGIVFWGGEKSHKGKKIAKFICPECDNIWTTGTWDILNGVVKSCGCIYGRGSMSQNARLNK